jgi:hypothetical protein
MRRARAELSKNGKYVARRSGIVRRGLGRPGAEPDKLEKAKKLLALDRPLFVGPPDRKLPLSVHHEERSL